MLSYNSAPIVKYCYKKPTNTYKKQRSPTPPTSLNLSDGTETIARHSLAIALYSNGCSKRNPHSYKLTKVLFPFLRKHDSTHIRIEDL
jgi:hypothetical protein